MVLFMFVMLKNLSIDLNEGPCMLQINFITYHKVIFFLNITLLTSKTSYAKFDTWYHSTFSSLVVIKLFIKY
jgi:hypothetical protein